MKVLIIGGGGREHALAWKLSQSPEVTKIFCAPGNAGIAAVAECVDIPVSEHLALIKFAADKAVDLVVVGPEDPLVGGIVDKFKKRGMRVFGPTARAARLEGSKAYAKELMIRHGIPTSPGRAFRDYDLAVQYLNKAKAPIVVKADGPAAGKGVTVCRNIDEARKIAREMMREGKFGAAGATVVFEECVYGEEISLLAVSDGHTIVPFQPAQDHKAIFDGDKGPNTGGMGTYSPLPQYSDEIVKEVERDVIVQTIHAMNCEGEPFVGCLFAGLMMTEDGPKVLEFNVRFGDPETQSLLVRLKSDLFPLLWRACDGTLDQCDVEWDERPSVTVVLAAGGYPGRTEPATVIKGIDKDFGDNVAIFHAGTKLTGGQYFTAGGRVLGVTALGTDLNDARERAYAAAREITFAGRQMRTDIGMRGASRSAAL